MLLEYIEKALEKAKYKKLKDRSWFAEIPGFSGVWANGRTLELCRRELKEVLEEWIILKLRDREPADFKDPIPEDGTNSWFVVP